MHWNMLMMALVWVIWTEGNNSIFFSYQKALPILNLLDSILYFVYYWADNLTVLCKRKVDMSIPTYARKKLRDPGGGLVSGGITTGECIAYNTSSASANPFTNPATADGSAGHSSKGVVILSDEASPMGDYGGFGYIVMCNFGSSLPGVGLCSVCAYPGGIYMLVSCR